MHIYAYRQTLEMHHAWRTRLMRPDYLDVDQVGAIKVVFIERNSFAHWQSYRASLVFGLPNDQRFRICCWLHSAPANKRRDAALDRQLRDRRDKAQNVVEGGAIIFAAISRVIGLISQNDNPETYIIYVF